MQQTLAARLLHVASEMEGHFATPAELAEHLGESEWKVIRELDRLLIMLKIDKFDLITEQSTSSHYGIHRGVRPGEARINQALNQVRESNA